MPENILILDIEMKAGQTLTEFDLLFLCPIWVILYRPQKIVGRRVIQTNSLTTWSGDLSKISKQNLP